MRWGRLFFPMALMGVSSAWADQPASVFEGFWSAQCLGRQGGLVSEYTVFTPNEWCRHIVDDWRTHSMCQNTRYEPLPNGEAILDVDGIGRYRAKWTGVKLILEPLDGAEPEAYAPAIRRKDGKDRFLTCP